MLKFSKGGKAVHEDYVGLFDPGNEPNSSEASYFVVADEGSGSM